MIDRLYDNGMLLNGEARHCNCWEYPTMPRLRREPIEAEAESSQFAHSESKSRKRGYVALIFDAFRVR